MTTEAPFPFGHLDQVEDFAVAPETLSKVIVAPERVSHTILTGPNIPTVGKHNGVTSMIKGMFFLALGMLQISAYYATAQDVRYNFDKDTDFTRFKTYRWVELKDASKVDSLRDKSIRESIDTNLAQKGLSKTDADSADLLVGYQAGVGTEKQFTSYNTGWGYGGGWYRGGWYGPTGTTTTGQTSTIYTGQLALDMYDSKNHDLVWRGVVSKTIDPEAKPEKQEKNLNKAVTKLLKNYPPQVKK